MKLYPYKYTYKSRMKNYINKEFALAQSPTVGEDWNKDSEFNRIEKIHSLLKAHSEYSFFEVIAYDKALFSKR